MRARRESRAPEAPPSSTPMPCSPRSVQRSLISFRNLRAHGIHALTAIRDGEEILKLMQGGMCLPTTRCAASGLYEIPISSLTTGYQNHSAYSVTIPEKAKLWHWRMGHSRVTMFRRMIHVLTSHEVYLSDARKLGVCEGRCSRKLHPQAFALEVAARAPSTTPLAPKGHMRSHRS